MDKIDFRNKVTQLKEHLKILMKAAIMVNKKKHTIELYKE